MQTHSDPRYTRRTVVLGTAVVGATLATAGCLGQDDDAKGSPTDGPDESASDGDSDPSSDGETPVTGEVSQHGDIQLSSPAFDDGEAIPEGWEPEQAQQGTNDFDEVGYGGPSPPDGEHRYRFNCFALDTTLDLPQATDSDYCESLPPWQRPMYVTRLETTTSVTWSRKLPQ